MAAGPDAIPEGEVENRGAEGEAKGEEGGGGGLVKEPAVGPVVDNVDGHSGEAVSFIL